MLVISSIYRDEPGTDDQSLLFEKDTPKQFESVEDLIDIAPDYFFNRFGFDINDGFRLEWIDDMGMWAIIHKKFCVVYSEIK